jgi:hypothetical protein
MLAARHLEEQTYGEPDKSTELEEEEEEEEFIWVR